MKRNLIALSTLCALALTANNAMAAQDHGLYLLGAVGQTKTDRKAEVDNTITAIGITAFTSTGNEEDTGWKLQVGWRFNPYVAIEGGYVNLGKYSYSAASTAPIVATRSGSIKVDGWNVGLAGTWPVTQRLDLFAKAGLLAYNLDYHCSGTGVACVNPNRSKSGTRPQYGIGAGWHFSNNWFGRLEYDQYKDIGESFNTLGTTGTTKDDIRLISAGIGYRF